MAIRVGIVGAGIIGENHAAAFRKVSAAELVAVADVNVQARESLARSYGIPRSYATCEEMLADSAPDLVVVGTPHDCHMPITLAAFECGAHVMCEKPIACTLEEADAMIAAARKADRRLFVGHNHRFVPANQMAARLIGDGAIGRPFLCMSAFVGNELARMNDPHNWVGTPDRCGGGVIIANLIHMIDLLRYFLGDVEAVTAACARLVVEAETKAEDTGVATLEFAGGALGNLSGTFGASCSHWPSSYMGAAIRNDLFGTEGAIQVGNVEGHELVLARDGELKIFNTLTLSTGLPDSEQQHFVDCILRDEEPIVTAEDGRAALAIVQAMYRSAKEGRRVRIAEVG